VLIILVLGGYGRIYGAFIGAVAYMALSHFLAKAYPDCLASSASAFLLVVIALFARNGMIGLWISDEALPHEACRTMSTPLLETRGLSINFGALAATRDVSLRLDVGARHALIAPTAPARPR